VFIAWYGAMERLGVDRTGLFNGLIPVTSLAAVALTGTGTITPSGLLGALFVLAGVIHGLSRAPHAPAGTASQAGQHPQPTAEPIPISPHTRPAPAPSAMTHTTPRKAAA